MQDDGYVTYNFSCFGCALTLLGVIAAWCLLIYGSYNLVAWALH